ncbi:hypothetical protein DEO72_LG3g937 [Vigna unguiculata]|uniref:Uncharacterized protein n=1 Tax=Vigna unguiculata TaxID=3917 RepID=A0A4D6LDK2_VIGUN|nr:hypothetical protein DEO72_LG3g937 [Vigna unguiculata]
MPLKTRHLEPSIRQGDVADDDESEEVTELDAKEGEEAAGDWNASTANSV